MSFPNSDAPQNFQYQIGDIVQVSYNIGKETKVIKLYVFKSSIKMIFGWLVFVDRQDRDYKKDKSIYRLLPIRNYNNEYIIMFAKERKYTNTKVTRVFAKVSTEEQQRITKAYKIYKVSKEPVDLRVKHNHNKTIPPQISQVLSGGKFSSK